MASIGMTAISWNSNTAKPDCPVSVPACPCSSITFSAIAVDERAKPIPITKLTCMLNPNRLTMLPITAVVTITWAPPRPRMGPRICHNFLGFSSKPIKNSSNTTPSSAKCRIASTSLINPSPQGPIRTPAIR